MNPAELFEKFPDVLLLSFRKQMLLGIVPADTVQTILEPLLSDFYEIMLQLPPELQADFENILRLYPDVAERFGVWINPPVVESLRRIARYRPKPGLGERLDYLELDMAAEPQQGLEITKKSFPGSLQKEGQGFFTTDRGSSVYIEFSCPEQGEFASFEYKPHRLDIEIHICGVYTTTLTPRSPKQTIPLDNLFQILMKCAGEIEIKIIELT